MDEYRHIAMMTAIIIIIMSGVYQSAIVVSGSGNCKLPTIKNADINMTGIYRFSEGTAVHFHCLPGFRAVGDGLYRCTNRTWIGGNFSCLIKTCPLLESPKHGEMIGDNYEVGSVMRYKCDTGFELIGSKTSLCKMDQQWDPPNIPECQIKKCLAAPVIEHGEFIPEHITEGFDYYAYGAIMRARCNSGYTVNGPVRIYCDSNGQWTQIPECRPISCPSYPGLDAKCVRKTTLADKTLLMIFCTANSTLKSARDGTASCENNVWDDLSIRCLCDCEIKADTDFVHIENLNPNGVLKHNETLEWSCKNGSTKTINDSLTCFDGSVKPQGWGCIPVDPFDGTGNGTVEKSRNEDEKMNKVALASWVIALIAIGAVCAIMGAILIVYVMKRRLCHDTLIDRDFETDLNRATDTIQENTEHESMLWCFNCLKRSQRNDELEKEIKQARKDKAKLRNRECKIEKMKQNKETKSTRPATSPLKEKEITEDFADKLDLWELKLGEKNKQSQDDDTEQSNLSHCNEADAPLLSQEDGAQTKELMSQDISKLCTDKVGESVGEAEINTSEFESNLSSCEEQQSLIIPTTGQRKNIIGLNLMQAVDQERNKLCPRCDRIVHQAEARLASGRMWHNECFLCKNCRNPIAFPYEHGGEIYCSHCYGKKFGHQKHLRYDSQEALDKDAMDKSTTEKKN